MFGGRVRLYGPILGQHGVLLSRAHLYLLTMGFSVCIIWPISHHKGNLMKPQKVWSGLISTACFFNLACVTPSTSAQCSWSMPAQFSSTQGGNNWYYGYTQSDGAFQLMTEFDVA